MKYILPFLLITSVHANLQIKSGLWGQKATVFVDGVNMNDQVSKILESIPKAQQQMVKDMMKSQGGGDFLDILSEKKTCLTQKMIDNPEKLAEVEKGCTNKITKKTKSELEMTTECKNGVKGKTSLKAKNDKSYTGQFEGTTKDKKAIKVAFVGTFIDSKCK